LAKILKLSIKSFAHFAGALDLKRGAKTAPPSIALLPPPGSEPGAFPRAGLFGF
jgi:hypothetical protein